MPDKIPKDANETLDAANELIKFWEPRTKRGDTVRGIYALDDKVQNARKNTGLPYFKTNEPKVLVNSIISLISDEEQYIVPITDDTYAERQIGSKIERYITGLRRATDDDLIRNYSGNLSYANAKNIVLRGWFGAARVIFSHRRALAGYAPVDVELWDPHEVFPEPGAKEPERVIRVTEVEPSRLESRWGYRPENDRLKTVRVFDDWFIVRDKDDKPAVYEGVIVEDVPKNARKGNGLYLLEPKKWEGLTRIPIITGPVGGGVIRPPVEKAHGLDWREELGRDAFAMTDVVYEQFNEHAAVLAQIARKHGYGAVVAYGKNGEIPDDIAESIAMGGTINAGGTKQEGFGIEPVALPSISPDWNALTQLLGGLMEQGGVPAALRGQSGAYSSGFLHVQVTAAAMQVIKVFLEAQRNFYKQLAAEFLWQFQTGGFKPITLNTLDASRQLVQETFKPSDLKKRYYVDVHLSAAIPTDDMSNAQVGLVWKQIGLDMYTILEQFGKFPDVEIIRQRKLREDFENDPIVKLMRIIAAFEADGEVELANIAKQRLTMAKDALAQAEQQSKAKTEQATSAQEGQPLEETPSMRPSPDVMPPEMSGQPPNMMPVGPGVGPEEAQMRNANIAANMGGP